MEELNTQSTPEASVNASVIDKTPVEATSSAPITEVKQDWSPNYKVKAYDKEYEIPEDFRSFINKDNEAKFRDVFEKMYALDEMKSKNQKIREHNEKMVSQIEKEYAPNLSRYQKIEKYLKNDDFDAFFGSINLPEEKLQKWMLQKLQMRDLPEEQQALYNNSRAAQQRAYQLEEENALYKQQFEQFTNVQRENAVNDQLKKLDDYVNSPQVSQVVKDFDSRLGQDGSFKIEVLRRAAVIAKTTGKDLSVEEAVGDFLKVLGHAPEANQQNNFSQPQAQKKPTLPSLAGKATSPVAQKVKTMEDLHKLRAQMLKEVASQQ